MDYSEKWGVDIEEAVKLALMDLKVSRDEVEVIVLEEPSKGFFGIGSKLAKVRVEKKKPEIVEEEVIEVKKPEPQKTDAKPHAKDRRNDKKKPKDKKDKKDRKDREEHTLTESNINIEVVNKDELKDIDEHEAITFLKEITEKMGLSLNLKAKEGDGIIYVEMDGKDSGTVIGKRGQTLDAIQYLTSLVVNKDSEKYVKVVVDAENYRAKRQKTLEQLANRLASKVIKTRKHVRLEPMNPYERKVIHATLQQNPHITTRSEGEEPYRRVVIELKK